MNPAAGSGEGNLRSALNKAELQALDALKLQYFQNATRYLAKGEYEFALAEIKRVLLIDPDHHLAREYEVRVNQLQTARAHAPKPSPIPLKEPPRTSRAPAESAGVTSSRASRKTLFYAAMVVCVLLGTAGIVTLEKGNDREQPAVAPVELVPAAETSAPAEQHVESVQSESTPLPTVPLSTSDTRRPAVAEEKREPPPEPVRRETPGVALNAVKLVSAPPSDATPARRSEPPPVEKREPPVEKKVEAPLAPEKKEIDAPLPENKTAAVETPPAEPPRESKPFVAVEKDPQIVRLEKPRLPDIVMRNHMSGQVTAKVLIGTDGQPQEVQILSSTSSIFEQPVIDAISKSTFSPGMMGTGPVASWVVIPFKFK